MSKASADASSKHDKHDHKNNDKNNDKASDKHGKHRKRRPLDADTLWQMQRIGSLALAPDGRHAVCSVTSYSMDDNQASTHLWLLPTDRAAPRLLTSAGGKDGQPAWSPQGDHIAFIARREQQGKKDGTPQLYVMPASGGEARRASDFGPGIESFKWLPSGKQIVFAAWVWPALQGAAAQSRQHKLFSERKETGYATSEAFYRHWDHHVPMGRVLHLLLLDVASGRITDLFEGSALELPRHGGGNDGYAVRPDGQRIAFVHDTSAVPRASDRLALSEIDVGAASVPASRLTHKVHALLDHQDWDVQAPSYSPDGRFIAITAAHVGRHHTAMPEPAVLEPATGTWALLAPGWDHAVDAPLKWSPGGQALYFAAEENGRRHLWRHTLGEARPVLAQQGGWVQDFDVVLGQAANSGTGRMHTDPDHDLLAIAADSASHPVRVTLRSGIAATLRLEHFNDALLADVALGDVQEVTITGALNEPVQMWLTFPPGFKADVPHAVLQLIHGGPFAASGDSFSYRWNPHVVAAAGLHKGGKHDAGQVHGQVVAQVNYHGSSGFGFAFRHSLIGRQGELELQDIEAGTDWLLAQTWADPQRLCAAGGSYGGFLVAWMNGHLPAWPQGRYRAYVCHAGVYDRLATFSADSYTSRPKDLAANYWENMPRVLAQSPHNFAKGMRTPTLVIHGAQDFRVPDCNGLAYYNTLQALGVDARLLWFPDENHWVLKPRNSRLWYTEFMGWLERHNGSAKKGHKHAVPVAAVPAAGAATGAESGAEGGAAVQTSTPTSDLVNQAG